MVRPTLEFGEHAVSWRTVWNDLYPVDSRYDPHDDAAAAEMHRLRGLVMAQASETEEVLGLILDRLDPSGKTDVPAGALLKGIRDRLADHGEAWSDSLDLIKQAIERRNRVVHDTVEIGSVWQEYQTGGGWWVPVISFLGGNEYDECDLVRDLALQQQATVAAVHILHSQMECRSEGDGEGSGSTEPIVLMPQEGF